MSQLKENNPDFTVREGSYWLTYKLVHSINPYFEEYELLEYGIECRLFNSEGQFISDSTVAHISPDQRFVVGLLHTIALNKVFPVHLLDVVEDLLLEDPLVPAV
ncbi:MAG: hypothetical protein E7256_06940 [Lachnospiraceae bacterium]|nr:hypothetical protein [Lachnospiraceae bacterium]